jgi:hypothetical protein
MKTKFKNNYNQLEKFQVLVHIQRSSPLDLLWLRVFDMLGPLRTIKTRLYAITHGDGLWNILHVHH